MGVRLMAGVLLEKQEVVEEEEGRPGWGVVGRGWVEVEVGVVEGVEVVEGPYMCWCRCGWGWHSGCPKSSSPPREYHSPGVH
jgi:hypothetical protein